MKLTFTKSLSIKCTMNTQLLNYYARAKPREKIIRKKKYLATKTIMRTRVVKNSQLNYFMKPGKGQFILLVFFFTFQKVELDKVPCLWFHTSERKIGTLITQFKGVNMHSLCRFRKKSLNKETTIFCFFYRILYFFHSSIDKTLIMSS